MFFCNCESSWFQSSIKHKNPSRAVLFAEKALANRKDWIWLKRISKTERLDKSDKMRRWVSEDMACRDRGWWVELCGLWKITNELSSTHFAISLSLCISSKRNSAVRIPEGSLGCSLFASFCINFTVFFLQRVCFLYKIFFYLLLFISISNMQTIFSDFLYFFRKKWNLFKLWRLKFFASFPFQFLANFFFLSLGAPSSSSW